MKKKLIFMIMGLINIISSGNNIGNVPFKNIFSYDLGVKVIPSKSQSSELTICCHGYGHCNKIVDAVSSYGVLTGTLVGFNFPDYNIRSNSDHSLSSFGSIQEILPLLYLVKYYVCEANIPKINLYGFSAGGGAIINALAILNKQQYKDELAAIGITQDVIPQIINALAHGHIILDCPLKSIEEVMALRGKSPAFKILDDRFKKNNMNPIDTVQLLDGLKLNLFLHFEKPDEILSNRDDELFIKRLKRANGGKTVVTSGSNGGHNTYHRELWNEYKNQ